MATGDSLVEGFDYPDTSVFDMNPRYKTRTKPLFAGQTALAAGSSVADQAIGVVALPALNAGATGTVTITNARITTISHVFLTVKRGTTTAGAGAVGTVVVAGRLPGSGSLVVDVTNLGSAATLSTDYDVQFLICN